MVILFIIIGVTSGGNKKTPPKTAAAGQSSASKIEQELRGLSATSTVPPTSSQVTAPPVTAPPVTAPPATAPPVTSPPVTSPPATAPPSTASCTANMSNPDPGDSGDDTVNITSNVPNAPVTIMKYYKTTTSTDSGITDANGSSSITFDIGHPTIGYTVQVSVNINNGAATCSTSFTPQ